MAEESETSRWQRISGRFLGLNSTEDFAGLTNLNLILDELNSVDYNSGIVVGSKEEALAVLSKGCSLVPSDGNNSSLSSKLCQLINNICSRQKVELNKKCLDELLEFLVNSIAKCQRWAVNDHLRALGAVLYETGPMCGRFARILLSNPSEGILSKNAQCLNSDPEVQCNSIHCIRNLCMRSPNGCSVDDELITIALQVLLSLLSQAPSTNKNEIQHLQIINTALKALLSVLDSVQSGYKALLSSLLAALKNYTFYGMPGFKPSFLESRKNGNSESSGLKPDDISSINLQPISVKQASYLNPQPKKKKKRPGSKKSKKEQKVLRNQDFMYSSSKSSNMDVFAPSYLKINQGKPSYSGQKNHKNFTCSLKYFEAKHSPNKQPDTVEDAILKPLLTSLENRCLKTDNEQFYVGLNSGEKNSLSSHTFVNENILRNLNLEQKETPQEVVRLTNSQRELVDIRHKNSRVLDTKKELSRVAQDSSKQNVNHTYTRSSCSLDTESDEIVANESGCVDDVDENFAKSTGSSKPGDTESQTQRREFHDSLFNSEKGQQWISVSNAEGETHKKYSGHSSESEGFSSTASSDSEFSDSEAGYALRIRSMSSKVRQAALLCLQKLIKVTDRKVMFGYWSSFIPDSTSGLQWSIFTTILKDSAPKARANGVGVLAELLEGSRQFLLAAEERKHPPAFSQARPFTSFSTKLAGIVHELHRCLLQALIAESFVYTKVQILKCTAVLIANAPYHRLDRGLLTKLVKHLRPLLTHKDCCVCVAAMECLAMIVSVQAPLDEVIDLMKSEVSTVTIKVEDAQKPNSSLSGASPREQMSLDTSTSIFADQSMTEFPSCAPWLVCWCYQAVCRHPSTSVQPVSIRIQALQVITAFVKYYFTLCSASVPWLVNLSCTCSQEEDQAIALFSVKLLDELNKAMLANIIDRSQAQEAAGFTKCQLQSFWIRLLEGPLTKMMQSDGSRVSKLCSAAIDCLSGIGAPVFEVLSHNKQILCITLLLGLCNDEDKPIMASAVRALGVFVMYPCLREDVLFVADVANAVSTCMADTSLQVRTRAAWSLANLSDTLVVNSSLENLTFVEDFSDVLLLSVLNSSVTAAADNEKVKSNAVRAIGNFLRYLPPSLLDKRGFCDSIERGILALAKCVGSGLMKVRWNACYALGNVFRNQSLPLGTASWTVDAFRALTEVVHECKNFKVRYNAVLALSIPQKRSCYGEPELFSSIWETHVKALVATETITDFTEFRYRDNLKEQLCASLCHLATLVSAADVPNLENLMAEDKETLKKFIAKYREQVNQKISADELGVEDPVSNEKVREIVEAQQHLTEELTVNVTATKCLRHVFVASPGC